MAARFEVYKAPDGWRWRLRAGNREIVASGEAYGRRQDAVRGVAACRRAAAMATVKVLEQQPE